MPPTTCATPRRTRPGSWSRTGGAALQANCLSAVFFGAAKASFPLRGELLRQWTWLIQHGGDEHSKDKVRDHGSAKSLTLWMNQGFAEHRSRHLQHFRGSIRQGQLTETTMRTTDA